MGCFETILFWKIAILTPLDGLSSFPFSNKDDGDDDDAMMQCNDDVRSPG